MGQGLTLRALAPVLAAVCLLAASCATVPPPVEQSRWLDVLPPESSVFAAADVGAARGLLEGLAAQAGLEDRQVADVLGRTARAYVAVGASGQGLPQLDLVALGDFGPGALALQLSFDRRWRKHVVGERLPQSPGGASGGGPGDERSRPDPWLRRSTYWEHLGSPLQLASPRRGVLLASTGGVELLLRRLAGALPALLPADAREDLEQAELFLFLPFLPGGGGGLELSALPIRSVWLAARRDPLDYRVAAVFTMEAVSNERAVERLFRLLIPLLLRRAQVADPVGKLKGLKLSVSPTRVRIDDLRLAVEEVSRFLEDFMPRVGDGDAGRR